MSRSLVIEDEQGTYRGHVHPHNGYYAGNFSSTDARWRPDPPYRPSDRPNGATTR
jgi:hypothetical protein